MKKKDIRFLLQVIYALFLCLLYCCNNYLLNHLPSDILNIEIIPKSLAFLGIIIVTGIFFILWYVWMKLADNVAEIFGK